MCLSILNNQNHTLKILQQKRKKKEQDGKTSSNNSSPGFDENSSDPFQHRILGKLISNPSTLNKFIVLSITLERIFVQN